MAKKFSGAPKIDIHQAVTDQIIRLLEKGVRPWVRSWGTAGDDDDDGPVFVRPLRFNGIPYRGINVLILWATAMEKGFVSPYWMTYNQAKEFGAQVRKGETATRTVFYKSITKERDDGEVDHIPLLNWNSVFNVDQIDGLPEKYQLKTVEPVVEPVVNGQKMERLPAADAFFEAIGADVRHGGSKAFYSPSTDRIHLPMFEKYHNVGGYYTTRGHETVHWTQHATRLDRSFGRERWGDEGYAAEELVAELGAAYLMADLNIDAEPREDHASYIEHWLNVLKNDKKAIFTAASYAEKAVTFLHGIVNPSVPVAVEDEELSVAA